LKSAQIEHSATADLLSMIGIALAISLIVGLVVASIGMVLFLNLGEMTK
jgi:hypothetical protein